MSLTCAFAAAGLPAAFLLPPAPALAQADYARERRWADEIAPGIVIGEFARAEDFRAPVLDLYGEKDYPGVFDSAAARARCRSRMPTISSPAWKGNWCGRSGNSWIQG